MILIDTSIWIDHFRTADRDLLDMIDNEDVLTHPFIIGEIALGSLRDRDQIVSEMSDLPFVLVAQHREVLALLDLHGIPGSGIGWVDAHLLCSARLTPDCRLWTRDKRLHRIAERLEIAR